MFLCKLEVLSIEVKANPGEAMDTLTSQERVSHWGISGRGKSVVRQPAGEGLETQGFSSKKKMPGRGIPFN